MVLPALGDKKLGSVTPADVARLIRQLEQKGLRPKTISNYLLPLSSTFNFARSRRYVSHNPCADLTPDERPARHEPEPAYSWSQEELDALLESADYLARQPESRYDYAPILRLAVWTGLRLGECLGLQWQDVVLEARELHVRRQWTKLGKVGPPKTAKAARRVPLSDNVVRFLAAHKLRSAFSADGDFVFPTRNGKGLSHRNVQSRGFDKAADLAGIEGVTFHDLRHAFASRMIYNGINSTDLAAVMGHESSTITERVYIHQFNRLERDDKLRAAMGG